MLDRLGEKNLIKKKLYKLSGLKALMIRYALIKIIWVTFGVPQIGLKQQKMASFSDQRGKHPYR